MSTETKMKWKWITQGNFNEIVNLIHEPYSRLAAKIQDARQICNRLEHGEPVDPKKLKKIIGGIDYWADKLAKVGWTLIGHPDKVLGAYCEASAFIAGMEKEKERCKAA